MVPARLDTGSTSSKKWQVNVIWPISPGAFGSTQRQRPVKPTFTTHASFNDLPIRVVKIIIGSVKHKVPALAKKRRGYNTHSGKKLNIDLI